MGWITGVAIYFVVWWTVLFAVLPWGAHTLDDTDAGRSAGAPSKPRIGLKFLVTTVIAAIIWVLIYLTITSGLISFRN